MAEVTTPSGEKTVDNPVSASDGGAPAQSQEQAPPKSLMTQEMDAQGDEGKEAPAEDPEGKTEDKAGEEKDGDKSLAVPESPEGYEISLPEGLEVDQEFLGQYRGKAHELGLNQKQFQDLASMYAEKVGGAEDVFRKGQMDSVIKAGEEWAQEIQGRPTFKADLAAAKKALAYAKKTMQPESFEKMAEYLDVSQAGNFPPFFEMISAFGKAMGEPVARGQGMGPGEKSAAEVLYPNQGKK